MRGNCDLDLRLSPSSSSLSDDPPPSFLHHVRRRPMGEELSNKSPQNQKITIFYNGMICVSDVTELQLTSSSKLRLSTRQQIYHHLPGPTSPADALSKGKAILMLAAKEMEEKLRAAPLGSRPNSPNTQSLPSNPPNHSLHMRRSLQAFLQKRKNRIQSASPYHCR